MRCHTAAWRQLHCALGIAVGSRRRGPGLIRLPACPGTQPVRSLCGLRGATYLTRDAVSCRILLQQFGWNQDFVYEFWWAEVNMDDIRTITEMGMAVVFVDQVMTTPPFGWWSSTTGNSTTTSSPSKGRGRGHRCGTRGTGLGENRIGLHRVATRPERRPADFSRPVPLLRVPDHRAQQPLPCRSGARVRRPESARRRHAGRPAEVELRGTGVPGRTQTDAQRYLSPQHDPRHAALQQRAGTRHRQQPSLYPPPRRCGPDGPAGMGTGGDRVFARSSDRRRG